MSASAVVLPSQCDSDRIGGSMEVDCCGSAGRETKAKMGEDPAVVKASNQKVLIFDWDDTLLCSTWLAGQGLRLDSPTMLPAGVVAELKRLESAVIALLTSAQKYGEVVIITNAETGWVELSAQRFLPGVVPLVKKLTVLSARSTFERHHPDNPYEWKVAAFRQEVTKRVRQWETEGKDLDSVDSDDSSSIEDGATTDDDPHATMKQGAYSTSTSSSALVVPSRKDTPSPTGRKPTPTIVSFGDSVHERDAVWTVTGEIAGALTKSIKFVERPTLEQLCREVNLVRECMDYIVSFESDLDLMITISLLDQKANEEAAAAAAAQGDKGDGDSVMDEDDNFSDEEGVTSGSDESEGAVTPTPSAATHDVVFG